MCYCVVDAQDRELQEHCIVEKRNKLRIVIILLYLYVYTTNKPIVDLFLDEDDHHWGHIIIIINYQ